MASHGSGKQESDDQGDVAGLGRGRYGVGTVSDRPELRRSKVYVKTLDGCLRSLIQTFETKLALEATILPVRVTD